MYIFRLISKTYYFYVLLRQVQAVLILSFKKNNGNNRVNKEMNSFLFYGTFTNFEDENCIDLVAEKNRYSSIKKISN